MKANENDRDSLHEQQTPDAKRSIDAKSGSLSVKKQRTLGGTGLQISEIGFGGCAIGGSLNGTWGYGPTNDNESLAALQKALDLGCTFFDTADTYGSGHSEHLLGRILQGSVRSRVVVATKVGYVPGCGTHDFSARYLQQAVERSLLRLNTPYIDILQLHNPPPEILRNPELINAVDSIKRSGSARHVGVSVLHHNHLSACLDAGWVETVQVRYNLLDLDAKQSLHKAAEAGLGVIAREPLANGCLCGIRNADCVFASNDFRSLWSKRGLLKVYDQAEQIKKTVPTGQSLARHAIASVLEESSVSVVIVGCKTVEQVRENFGDASWTGGVLPPKPQFPTTS